MAGPFVSVCLTGRKPRLKYYLKFYFIFSNYLTNFADVDRTRSPGPG